MTDIPSEIPSASDTEGDDEEHIPVGRELMDYFEITEFKKAEAEQWDRAAKDNK